VKVVELKRLEQRGKMMEEFVQEFRRAARRSMYEERPLVEELKRGINITLKTHGVGTAVRLNQVIV